MNAAISRSPRRFTGALITMLLISASMAHAQAPAATITSINPGNGVVIGRVTATGQSFQFSATPAQLKTLRIGQPLYVNLKTNQVSLDGRSVFATITTLTPAIAARTGSVATGGSPAACCSVTGVLQGQNLAHGKVTSSGQVFDFALNNPAQMPQLHSGQPIYANFTTKQVSLDGQQPAGYIVQPSAGNNLGSSASAATAAPTPPPNTATTPATGGSATQQNPVSPATTGITNSVSLPAPPPAPDFAIAFAPGEPASLAPGTPVSLPITVTRIGNFNGAVNLSYSVNGYQSNAQLTPTVVTLGCSAAAPRPGSLTPTPLACVNTASATLNTAMGAVLQPPPGSGQSPAYPSLLITITGTNTTPVMQQGYQVGTNTLTHSAHLQIASPPPAAQTSTGLPVSPIMINEFGRGVDPSTGAASEFVELYNSSNQTYDLTNHLLTFETTGGGMNTIANFSTAIPAQGYYVVWRQSLGPSALGGILVLRMMSGMAVDAVAFGNVNNHYFSSAGFGANPFAAAAQFASVGREPNGANTNNNTADFQTNSLATPGDANR